MVNFRGSFNNFFINVAVPVIIAGLFTSFLLAKDAKPPNFLKKYSIYFTRTGSGIFSSCIFVFLKTTSVFFLSNLLPSGLNFGTYLLGLFIFLIIGIILGYFSGKLGAIFRNLLG